MFDTVHLSRFTQWTSQLKSEMYHYAIFVLPTWILFYQAFSPKICWLLFCFFVCFCFCFFFFVVSLCCALLFYIVFLVFWSCMHASSLDVDLCYINLFGLQLLLFVLSIFNLHWYKFLSTLETENGRKYLKLNLNFHLKLKYLPKSDGYILQLLSKASYIHNTFFGNLSSISFPAWVVSSWRRRGLPDG